MAGNGPISKQLPKKKNGEWSETCFGFWTHHMTGVSNQNGKSNSAKSAKKSTTVCTGINFVKVKNLDIASIEPTSTIGLQVIVSDTEVTERVRPEVVNSSDDILSHVQHLYNSYDKKVESLFKSHVERMKNNSNSLVGLLKDLKVSSEKMNAVSTSLYKECNKISEWLKSLWK